MTFTPRGQDWLQAAQSAQLGAIAEVADWYEQARITVEARRQPVEPAATSSE